MISYLARDTWLHRIPAGFKLGALALLSFAILPVDDWRLLTACLALPLALYLSCGRDGLKRMLFLAHLWPILTIIAAFQLYAADWRAALSSLSRLVLMVALADIVTMTTLMQAMMDAIHPFLKPLRYVGLNPRRLALAVTLVIRFVPLLMEHWAARAEAWRARGGRRMPVRAIAPFIADTLRFSDRLAETLAARGFAGEKDSSKLS